MNKTDHSKIFIYNTLNVIISDRNSVSVNTQIIRIINIYELRNKYRYFKR